MRKKIYLLSILIILSLTFSSCIIKYGRIEINSEPQGAKMYLNGEDTGRLTPCVLEKIEFGEYEIVLKKFGFKDTKLDVKVDKRAILLNLTLSPLFSTLDIDSEPKWAMVFIDDFDTNKLTPCTIENISYSKHKINLYKTPYKPIEEEILVNNEKMSFHFKLQKIPLKESEKYLKDCYYPIIDGDYLYSIDKEYKLKKIDLKNYKLVRKWNLRNFIKVNNFLSLKPIKIYGDHFYFEYWIEKTYQPPKGSDLTLEDRIPIGYFTCFNLINEKIIWEKTINIVNEKCLDYWWNFLSAMKMGEEDPFTFATVDDKYAFIGQLEFTCKEVDSSLSIYDIYKRHFLILDRFTGEILKKFDENYSLFCGDPFYYDNKVYVRTKDKLYAYDLNKLEKIYEIPLSDKVLGKTIIGDKDVLILDRGGLNITSITSINRNNGDFLWTLSGYNKFLFGDYVYYIDEKSQSGYNGFNIVCSDKIKGEKIWLLQFPDVNNSLRILGISKNFLFTKQTIYYPKQKNQISYYICYDRNTKEALWYYSLSSTEYIYEELIFQNNKLFLVSPSQGLITIFNLN
ncbi:PEGA domain-containing protein [bacterium]|nr:PEGA domain-containing protein [bacterium]